MLRLNTVLPGQSVGGRVFLHGNDIPIGRLVLQIVVGTESHEFVFEVGGT
jgi:hypothetical protein